MSSVKNKSRSVDKFIINFHKTYGGNVLDETALNDKRRIVFVSLIGLFKRIKMSITYIVYIFIGITIEKWIYNPNRYQRELQQQFNGMTLIYLIKVC